MRTLVAGDGWLKRLPLLVVLLVWPLQTVWAAFLDETSVRLPVDGDDSYDFALADVNGNGRLDLLVANGGQSRLLMNDGAGGFVDETGARLPALQHRTIAVAFGDVDGVNGPDIILVGIGQNRLLVNDGAGNFSDQTTGRLPVATDISMGVAFADLDGDGHLDLVIANRGSRNQIWINDGTGVFSDESAARLRVDADPTYAVAVGDVDGDGVPDLFFANYGRQNRLHLNNRLGVFTDVTATAIPAATGETGAAVMVDLNGNGHLDIASAEGNGGLALLMNDGSGNFSPGMPASLPVLTAYGIKIAAGDIDFDGSPDLLLGAMGQDVILLNDGSGTFVDATATFLPVDDRRSFGLVLSDTDDDLDLDLLVATPQGQNRFYANAIGGPRALATITPSYIEFADTVTINVTAFAPEGVSTVSVVVVQPDDSSAVPTDIGGGAFQFVVAQIGAHVVQVTVVDGVGSTSVRQLSFEALTNDQTPPSIDSLTLSDSNIVQGQSVEISVVASDDRAVASLVLQVAGVSVPLDSSGRAHYTPTVTGSLLVEATATDPAGNVGSASAILSVDPDTVFPVVSLLATPNPVDITTPISISASASDDVFLASFLVTVTGPSGTPLNEPVALDEDGHGTYTPFFPGTYTFTATAADAAGNTSVETASVEAEGIPDIEAPEVTVTAVPGATTPGGIVTITVAATDNVFVASLSATVNGQSLALDESGQALYPAVSLGIYTVIATATDPTGNVGTASTTFAVVDPSTDVDPPVVAITSPAEDAQITQLTEIIGTATDLTLVGYELAYALVGTGNFVTFATGAAAVENGVLGSFDPTLLENGVYEIRLIAEDVIGRISVTSVVVNVTGDLKLGHFSVSFLDKALNIGRMPLNIMRVYDSRNRGVVGDFGHGWGIESTKAEAVENRLAGLDWEERVSSGFFPTYYIVPTRPHTVTVRFSEEEEWRFGARPSPDESVLFPIQLLDSMRYEPIGNARGTLVPDAQPDFFDRTSGQILDPEFAIYNPTGFAYRTDDNYVYRFVEKPGTSGLRHELRQVTNPAGTTITFANQGFTRSDGLSLGFQRDAQGRITRLTDPNGNVIEYSYDANGDLVAVTDAVGSTTTFIYDSNHYLLEIRDPAGRPLQTQEYDDDGRLIAVTDGAGNRVQMEYDVDANAQIIRDRRGNPSVYEYDARGNIIRETRLPEVNGVVTPVLVEREFDSDDQLLLETNGLGVTTSFTYNVRGERLTAVRDVGGLELSGSYTYDIAGRLLTSTDARGNTVSNVYSTDGKGNLLATTDRNGSVTTYEYNSAGQTVRETDALGNYKLFEYDGIGNRIAEQVHSGSGDLLRRQTFTYDANGNKLTETVLITVDGVTTPSTTTFAYDGNDRLVSITDPAGRVRRTEFDDFGRKSAEVDATLAAHRTEFSYNDLDEVSRIDYPDGTFVVYGYDADGNRVSERTRDGNTTFFGYDALNRITRIEFPDDSQRQKLFDAAGNLSAEIDELGNRTDHESDAVGRRIRTLQPEVFDAESGTMLRPETRYEYDANGNQTAVIDARGNRTELSYDPEGRLLATVFADGNSISGNYNALGQEIARTDAAGNTTLYVHDALGRRISTSLPRPATSDPRPVTRFFYDQAGRLIEQLDANGNSTTFEYDAASNRTARALPEGQRESFTHDGEGRVLTHTDFNGATTTYVYDAVGRPVSETYQDASTVTRTFTGEGNRVNVSDARGSTSFVYDSRMRLVSKVGPDGAFTYTYTPTSKQASVAVDSRVTAHGYDALGRLTKITTADGLETAHAYDAVGNLVTVRHDSGATVNYTYNSRNQLTSVVNRRDGGTVVSSHTYVLDPNGLRAQLIEPAATTTYVYDDVQRLVGETRVGDGAYSLQHTYDPVGNRLNVDRGGVVTNYSYDRNDRLLSEGAISYGYDSNGNRTSKIEGLQVTSYTFDLSNRLARVDAPAGVVNRYVYDVDGNRVQVRDANNAITSRYVVDIQHVSGLPQVLEEHDGSGSLIVSYSRGHVLSAQVRSGQVAFFHSDGTGSTRALTDTVGNVTDTYLYEAFGLERARTGSTVTEFGFAGEQYDVNSGFYYLRARHYDPRSGVFVGMDPELGDPQSPMSLHRYLYANNNPVNFSDPTGRFSLISVSISISINTNIRSIYTQNLVKFFLNTAKICFCSLEPAYKKQAMALDMIVRDLPGGWQLLEMSQITIAAAFQSIGREIESTFKNVAKDIFKVNVKISSDLTKLYDELVASLPYSSEVQKLKEFKDNLEKWLTNYADAMEVIDAAAAGDGCAAFTVLAKRAGDITKKIPSF